MSTAKVAISIPGDVLRDVDRAARERGETRSGYIRRILQVAARARRDADVTRRLNAVFADPAAAAEQIHSVARLDDTGTDWSDERW